MGTAILLELLTLLEIHIILSGLLSEAAGIYLIKSQHVFEGNSKARNWSLQKTHTIRTDDRRYELENLDLFMQRNIHNQH